MSNEQANAFRKHRDTVDLQGDLAWAARLGQKALRQSAEIASRIDVERDFGFTDEERVLWRLLKLPRKYFDLEHCGVLPLEKCRAFFRGLVAADAADIVDVTEAKALLPAEVKRLRAEVAGKEIARSSQPLRARVYRPDIDAKPGAEPVVEPAPEPKAEPKPPPPKTAPRGVPAPEKPAVLDSEQQLFKQEIERAYAQMAKQSHYEFMGLPRGCDDAAVRTAYMRLAREYHPDRVASGFDASLREKIDALFKRLGDAHEALQSLESRSTYDRELDALGAGGKNTPAGKRQRRPVEANNAFKMAETYFKKKELKQAEAHYRQAANFDPEDPKILTALAWCIFLNPAHDEKERAIEARKRLTDIVTVHKHGDAAYKLGFILRQGHDESAAQRYFAQAHRFDPEHVEAAREVRLAEMRHQKAKDEKAAENSLLGKFLKR